MKELLDNVKEVKQILKNFKMTISDEEASALLDQFNESEKGIFEKVIEQINKENSSFDDILDDVEDGSLKDLISLLINNPKFLEKTYELFLNKSID
ncbi:MAG: hypothetical protein EU549_03230 [Promethearchaeota archaeon]|nr:MAG: hypothetical protein EU549_03230 [Candidatus Lokiarchaeota archaeon]